MAGPIFHIGGIDWNYERDYTRRQLDILNGDVALEKIRRNELAAIIKKANARCDNFNYEIAQSLLDAMNTPCEYFPDMTVGEARQILQRLTPWELDW